MHLGHLYVSVGKPGVICVIGTGKFELAETVATEDGAHTIAVDTGSHTVYAFLPTSGGSAIYTDSDWD